MKKVLSWGILIINIVGVVCLICFAIPYITHSTVVNNPNAMLPAEQWDAAGMALTFGLIPLIIANLLGYLYVAWGTKKKRLLFFIPALIDLILVVSYWFCSLAG